MLHPSYTDLIDVVNSDIEPGEQPVVQSRYSIVIAASRRARQIIGGEDPMVSGAAGKKPLSIAIDELYHQKVKILPEEENPRKKRTRTHKIISRLLYIAAGRVIPGAAGTAGMA